MIHIRKSVLNVSQRAMAAIAAVSQSTVSKWEKGTLSPGRDKLARIREEAVKRGHDWDDRWFFEIPSAS
jgi:transcriptional regulator with XRE-family HTH domain